MQKSPETKEIVEVISNRKTKRNKSETVCYDKRRDWSHCGLCGSENIVEQGVSYCNKCEMELEYILSSSEYLFFTKKCNCGSYLRTKHVDKCVDCGAVRGPLCPVCEFPSWGKGLQVFCRKCGFMGERKIK